MKTREEKRAKYERERKKKFRHLKNTAQLSNYYKQKRESKLNQVIMAQVEPIKKEEKVETEIKKQTNMETKYNFIQGIIKAVKYVILFALGTLAVGLPAEWSQLTIAGVIVLVYNFLKIQWMPKLP